MHTVSIGNRFPWLYINFFSLPDSDASSQDLVFSRNGCQGGFHLSKERGDIKKGDEKRKGVDTPFCTMPHIITSPSWYVK